MAAAQHSFATGMSVLFVVGAAAVAAGALSAFTMVRSKDFVSHASPGSSPDTDGSGEIAVAAAEVHA